MTMRGQLDVPLSFQKLSVLLSILSNFPWKLLQVEVVHPDSQNKRQSIQVPDVANWLFRPLLSNTNTVHERTTMITAAYWETDVVLCVHCILLLDCFQVLRKYIIFSFCYKLLQRKHMKLRREATNCLLLTRNLHTNYLVLQHLGFFSRLRQETL